MDESGRSTSSTITIHDGRIYSDAGYIEIDGTIMTEGWSFHGSMDGSWPRVVIVDGTLRNEDADVEIEGRNLVLDPESEKGWRFNKDEGYIKLTRYAEEAKIEFECRRKKKGEKLVTTDTWHLDGERVEPKKKGERELKRILESAYHWLTFEKDHSPAPPAPEATPMLDVSPALPASPEKPADVLLREQDARSAQRVLRERARSAARDAERQHERALSAARDAEQRRTRLERERSSAEEDEYFTEGVIEIIDVIGEEFEKIENRYEKRLDKERTLEAITKAYGARAERIERIKSTTIAQFRSNPETSIVLEGCMEILDEYEKIAVSALESCRAGSRSVLHEALIDFYGDLTDAVADILDELENGEWGFTGSRLSDAQITICSEVREALERSRERIESWK
jgi:hypothetical protein